MAAKATKGIKKLFQSLTGNPSKKDVVEYIQELCDRNYAWRCAAPATNFATVTKPPESDGLTSVVHIPCRSIFNTRSRE